MKELVVLEKNEIYTTSVIISENLNMKHEHVVKLLKNYSYIEELSGFEIRKVSTKGRAIIEHLLTEQQALLLVSLMKNSPEVIKFKVKLVNAFIKYRNIAAKLTIQKNNADWLAKRHDTKAMRRECTDKIQKFIAYAESQGSKSASMYYMNITKMQLTGLFLMEQKFPNARDVMSMRQLNLVEMADEAIADSLEDAMNQGLHYKDCYKKAKEKIEALAKIFPPSPLPCLFDKPKTRLEA
jgi:phage regulator Rha-like protein